MRDLYQIFVHVAYGRGSVLLRQGDEIPREDAILRFSFPLTMHCNAFAAKGISLSAGKGVMGVHSAGEVSWSVIALLCTLYSFLFILFTFQSVFLSYGPRVLIKPDDDDDDDDDNERICIVRNKQSSDARDQTRKQESF